MNNPYTDMLIKGVSGQSGPLTLIVLLIVLATLVNALLSPKKRGRGLRSNGRYHKPRLFKGPHHDAVPSRMPDAADQLRTVMGARFKTKRLLNKGESRVLAALEPLVAELAPGWRVMAQVSLGEVLDADSTEAFNTINAKRVDFLLVDADLRPRHAIEYQGQGHHQGEAAARDAVKREALRRAGIGFGEVFPNDTPTELRQLVQRLCGAIGTAPSLAGAKPTVLQQPRA